MWAGLATPAAEGSPLRPLSGLDGAFLALETDTSRLHVAAVLVLDLPEGPDGSAESADDRFAAIRAVVEERLALVPRLRRRVERVSGHLRRPVWVDDPDLDLDHHLRRVTLPAPGGTAELDELVGAVLSHPLDLRRPLWEMVVVDGMAAGRCAVIARLHHAVIDGVSGVGAMAAFLDPSPRGRASPDESGDGGLRTPGGGAGGAGGDGGAGVAGGPGGAGGEGMGLPATQVPLPLPMPEHAAATSNRQPLAAAVALRRCMDAMVALAAQNRRLAAAGTASPPAPFSAPRTSLNGAVSGERRYARLAVPLEDLEIVRAAATAASAGGDHPPTITDVVVCAVAAAVRRVLERRGEQPRDPLVALVPVSTWREPTGAEQGPADVGNSVSGMLVRLPGLSDPPLGRLHDVSAATRVAKEQEERAGGDLLEVVTRALPPALVSAAVRTTSRLGLFDSLPPPFNVVVSTVRVPDVPLWWGARRVVEVYPAGPVAHGVGLNVTAMTYQGTVHVGLAACPQLLPDVDELAVLLDDAFAELVAAALDASPAGAAPFGMSEDVPDGRNRGAAGASSQGPGAVR